ncbi:hypothetical protein HPB50_020888 [Hyalomma asiaticum]|uniref:Uncharacterized protein n=1 Tax=Hyalomma asiaticum TaxID=266040 RepID=A0ACB7TAW7_HYAAI|nr:hypothetical protein HPB50_020888 [Hyalomma asiaticum]
MAVRAFATGLVDNEAGTINHNSIWRQRLAILSETNSPNLFLQPMNHLRSRRLSRTQMSLPDLVHRRPRRRQCIDRRPVLIDCRPAPMDGRHIPRHHCRNQAGSISRLATHNS